MTINREIWLSHTTSVLEAIADPAVLREAWAGRGTYATSPTEIYNEVFSDAIVDEYHRPELDLDDAQKAAGKEFVDRMRDFDKIGGPELPWQEVIDHPGWVEVRKAAQKFLDLLRPSAPGAARERTSG